MSIWVHVFCRKTAKSINPNELLEGIMKRFTLLCYLYGEDEPEIFSPRITEESKNMEGEFDVYLLSHKEHGSNPIRIERWSDKIKVLEEVTEFERYADMIQDHKIKNKVHDYLENTIETVGIELKLSDAEGLGWPAAISAAAWIAEYTEGIAYNESDGWFLPTEKEIRFLVQN